MWRLGYRERHTASKGEQPYAVGNRIAEAIIQQGLTDGANEGASPGYKDPKGYTSKNLSLNLITHNTAFQFPTGWNDMNHWQPLAFDYALTQNGQAASNVQRFIGSHWGEVKSYGMEREEKPLYSQPATPPEIEERAPYREQALEVIEYSTYLDPTLNLEIDSHKRNYYHSLSLNLLTILN